MWALVPLLSALAIVPALMAGMLSTRQDAVYAARADVVYSLQANATSDDNLRTDRRLSTQLTLLRSRGLLDPAAQLLGMTSEELRKNFSVSLVDNSEVFRLEAKAPTRGEAMKRVAAIANLYIERDRQGSDVRKTYLNEQLDALTTEQQSLSARLASLKPSAVDDPVNSEIDVVTDQLLTIDESRVELARELSELEFRQRTGGAVSLLGQPYALDDKVSPKPLLAVIAGLSAGLALAAAVGSYIIWRARRTFL